MVRELRLLLLFSCIGKWKHIFKQKTQLQYSKSSVLQMSYYKVDGSLRITCQVDVLRPLGRDDLYPYFISIFLNITQVGIHLGSKHDKIEVLHDIIM